MISIERFLIIVAVLLFGINAVKADELLMTTQTGRAPSKNLKMKSSKVPTFEIHNAKNGIPRLEIGEEAVLQFREPASDAKAPPTGSMKPVQHPASPAVVLFDVKKSMMTPAAASKTIVSSKDLAPAPEVKALKEIADPQTAQSSVEARKVKDLSSSENRLLEAQILFEKLEHPEIALGLLAELVDDKQVQTEARYTYALAARKLGLHSEFRATLMKIALDSKNKDWAKIATEALVRDVEALDISDMKILSDLVAKYEVETDNNDAYNFYRAKYFLEAGDLGQVEEALKHVGEKSKYHADALLIGALSAYRAGKIDPAQASLESLLKETSRGESIRSIGALTLARIHFQKGRYKEAAEFYLEVDRSHNLWMQAMVEQAWAQILKEDYEGAAGNMFSLHTDYFKNSFAPESYTVRSVAYLNLCQYGDGLQVLSNLRKKYAPLVGRLEAYKAAKKAPQDYYETVRNWLKSANLKEVDGLPRSFIVELARHPSFMNVQSQINNFEDEIENFGKATLSLIQKEKDLVRRESEIKAQIVKAREVKGNTVDLKIRASALETQAANLRTQYELAKKARGLIKDARARAIARLDLEKVALKKQASESLKKRLDVLVADLMHVLDQNEVVQYEIMAGAGEHLRAQSAGAKMNKEQTRLPADEKKAKWNFNGEIWEDEVGHFRSSLKNVCTQEDKIASY